jgi:hypothetical protein
LAGWYFRYQSIHIQITYTYQPLKQNMKFGGEWSSAANA